MNAKSEKLTTPPKRPVAARKKNMGAEVLGLIASGKARSRGELAEALGMAPSSISIYVQSLMDAGWLTESGSADSTGGRKPKILQLGQKSSYVLCADIGGSHATVAVMTADGTLGHIDAVEFDVTTGPVDGLARLKAAFDEMIAAQSGRLLSIGISLPGPVDVANGHVDSPSRMPGWHRYPVRAELSGHYAVPVTVENDANAMALGEYAVRTPRPDQMIVIKAGTAIGSGFIINGSVYHGATGVAGDITHVRTAAAGDTLCSCGNRGCLETIASGAAVVRLLQEAGAEVHSTADMVRLVGDADPMATGLVRGAGRHLGEVVSAIVNFFNPSAVYLNGVLSTLEPFVAAFRSQLYEGCHPLVTKELIIAASVLGENAGLVGIGRLALEQAFERPHEPTPTATPWRTHVNAAN
ncbi:ROK family transcriptional regulator [Arthrobacter dokdonensis]|uniref:ROK family transcriptional regulator n=1 Tax=Arthrobacter dokdonellae TaxID=2211210 RepID=UPI000DE5BC4B|nr:ROK family protein [Arthrobacter dokdonellae]